MHLMCETLSCPAAMSLKLWVKPRAEDCPELETARFWATSEGHTKMHGFLRPRRTRIISLETRALLWLRAQSSEARLTSCRCRTPTTSSSTAHSLKTPPPGE